MFVLAGFVVASVQKEICAEENQETERSDDPFKRPGGNADHFENAQGGDEIHSGVKDDCRRIQPEQFFVFLCVEN